MKKTNKISLSAECAIFTTNLIPYFIEEHLVNVFVIKPTFKLETMAKILCLENLTKLGSTTRLEGRTH